MPLARDVSGGIHSTPARLAEALELQDRQGSRPVQGLTQQVHDLLRDRPVLAAGPVPELLIERVGQVLDVEDRHRYLQIASIMEEHETSNNRATRFGIWVREPGGTTQRRAS